MRYIDPFALKLAQDLVADIVITNAAPVLCLATQALDGNGRIGGHATTGDDEFQCPEFGRCLRNGVDTKNLVERCDTEADDTGLVSHYERPVLPKPPAPRSLAENSATS